MAIASVDADGVVVPMASDLVRFTVEGPARLLAFGYHRGGPPGIVEGGSVARGLLHSALCAVLTVPL